MRPTPSLEKAPGGGEPGAGPPEGLPLKETGPAADYWDVADYYFTRGGERLQYQLSEDGSGYALTLRAPGGGSVTQRFKDWAVLVRRRLALEQMLASAGWAPVPATVARRRR